MTVNYRSYLRRELGLTVLMYVVLACYPQPCLIARVIDRQGVLINAYFFLLTLISARLAFLT